MRGKMFKFTPEAEEVLRRSGWAPSRSVVIEAWTDRLAYEGYALTPGAARILENFGGLEITPPKNDFNLFFPSKIVFDPIIAASGEFDRVDSWQRDLQTTLYPLGEVLEQFILLFAQTGRIYACTDGVLDILGENLEEAMELLIFARTRPRRHSPDRR